MTPDFLTAAVGLVAFLFSVIVHENAHGLAAEHFGDPTARSMGRITMNPLPHLDPIGSILLPVAAYLSGVPFLGWAKPVPVNSANLRNPVVDNAYVFKHVPGLAMSAERSLFFFNTLFSAMIQVNCVLALFNLIPIPPLDGHWILMRYLPAGPREAIASVGRWGFLILMVLLWSGVLWKFLGPMLRAVVSIYYSLVMTAVSAL